MTEEQTAGYEIQTSEGETLSLKKENPVDFTLVFGILLLAVILGAIVIRKYRRSL
ncbi:hypothetical protein H0V99_03660 [Candidatus Saccharibacteria bacterium]|nr:hypothetical protein [Candidatus Saccharibacteria bacterium]